MPIFISHKDMEKFHKVHTENCLWKKKKVGDASDVVLLSPVPARPQSAGAKQLSLFEVGPMPWSLPQSTPLLSPHLHLIHVT